MFEFVVVALVVVGIAALFEAPKEKKKKKMIYYRTKDGRADFGFSFERESDGTWRAYIQSMPDYGSRDTSLHTTHRLRSGGRYYVCWDSPLNSEREARSVAALWADLTQKYIRTGRTIDDQV